MKHLLTRQNLSLILYQTYAALRAESEKTYIGFAWWIIDPVLSMLVYYTVFSAILNRGNQDYIFFLFIGILPWRWFQTSLMHGSNTILGARNLMQQVHVPKIIFPVVSLLTNTFKFLIVFLILVVVGFLVGLPAGAPYVALPLVLLTQGLLIAALTVAAASVTPFFPDLRLVLQHTIRLWFFLSGIFYDINSFSPELQFYLRLNPMAVLIESYRKIMMETVWPDAATLLVIAGLGAGILVPALWGVSRFDHVYPKL